MIKAQDFKLFSRLYGLKQGVYIVRLWNTERKKSFYDFVSVDEKNTYFLNSCDSALFNCECVWLLNINDLPFETLEENGNLISLQHLKIGVVENG